MEKHQFSVSASVPVPYSQLYNCAVCSNRPQDNLRCGTPWVYVNTKKWTEMDKKISETYEKWQFPNCFAEVDGKHFGIICPAPSGSQFYSYKAFFSIVLLAFIDYDRKFIAAEVGCQGWTRGESVYRNSEFSYALQSKTLNLPKPRPLSKSNNSFWISQDVGDCTPTVFVVDDAFPLIIQSLNPYGGTDI